MIVLIEFLKQISLDKFLASTVKRVGLYAAEYGLMHWVAPSWMQTPLRFTALTAVGGASKGLFWWVISPKPDNISLEQSIVFEGPPSALAELDFVVVTPTHTGYDFSFKSIKHKITESTNTLVDKAGQYVLNITLGDLMEGTGAMIGSNLAVGSFIIFMGAPSLLSLPAYFLLEGTAKSFGAFCGREMNTYLLEQNHINTVTVEDEIAEFEWLVTPPPLPIVRWYEREAALVVIEDYKDEKLVDKQANLSGISKHLF